MTKIAVVGGTGKLGRMIINTILENDDVKLSYVIGRKGSEHIGKDISSLIGTNFKNITIIDEILEAKNCDVFIDCTNAKNFMSNNFDKYIEMKKPLVISTTGFHMEDIKKIEDLSTIIPVFKTGNFSIELKHQISSRKAFASGAVSIAKWIKKQPVGLYDMDDYCK